MCAVSLPTRVFNLVGARPNPSADDAATKRAATAQMAEEAESSERAPRRGRCGARRRGDTVLGAWSLVVLAEHGRVEAWSVKI